MSQPLISDGLAQHDPIERLSGSQSETIVREVPKPKPRSAAVCFPSKLVNETGALTPSAGGSCRQP